jgi:hypothetical protein
MGAAVVMTGCEQSSEKVHPCIYIAGEVSLSTSVVHLFG